MPRGGKRLIVWRDCSCFWTDVGEVTKEENEKEVETVGFGAFSVAVTVFVGPGIVVIN